MKRVATAWKTHCRCGAALAYSIEDVQTGQPAEGADYWCGDPKPEKGPHDWGVVVYQGKDAHADSLRPQS